MLRPSETRLWDLARSDDCSHRHHIAGKERAEEWLSGNFGDAISSVADPLTEIQLARIILREGITQHQLEEARSGGFTIGII